MALYRLVYAEPPYSEGESDFRDFADSLPRRAKAPNFRLVIARESFRAVGFAMGHNLTPNTRWWQGAITTLPEDLTLEHDGRTFAVIELAVLAERRRQGYARALHAHLLADLREERVTLLVRPDATAARSTYEALGYEAVGQIRPFPDAPIYNAMVRQLR
ncbi:GNAT family N-acetyltransferase [Actinomycetospora rhizophila]|uniref:GNAT family N-acetyltransferase n=1 Tax=Actinomycetospora rhizophila TaxID=1416876 RepID=A0ABV9ZHI5_9PSEU